MLHGTIQTLHTEQQFTQQSLGQLERGVDNLAADSQRNNAAVTAVANNMARNLQAIRNAFEGVNVAFTPISLPDPVFSVTNVVPDPGATDPSEF